MILNLLTLLGAIALFRYGMAMMSNSLQKTTSKLTPHFVPLMTSNNKLEAVLGGFGLTTFIQSSVSATVMVVSYVNAKLMSLKQAVAVIMGANIGTTITAWIVTFLMFTCNIGPYAYIAVALGFVLNSSKNDHRVREIGQLLIGVALMFIALNFVQTSLGKFLNVDYISEFLQNTQNHGYPSVLSFVAIGLLLTALIRSSSATIILTILMLQMGVIDFELGVAMVLGANIGTTLSATIVASEGNIQARQAALIHLLFNLSVALVSLALFGQFVSLTSSISSPLYGICLTHTLFNLFGTLIFIWFIPGIVRFVNKVIKQKSGAEDNNRLKYITGGSLGTPALLISQAFKEVLNFANVCYEGFSYVPRAIGENDPDKFEVVRKKLVEYEEITDKMEYEIASFLGGLTTKELTPEENGEVKILYRMIGELESLGDSGENISRLLQRTKIHNIVFDRHTLDKLSLMVSKVEKAYSVMIDNLRTSDTPAFSIQNAYDAEDDINKTRDVMRNEAVNSLESTNENYQSINYFLDLLSEFEAMGDFIINISQSLDRQFK